MNIMSVIFFCCLIAIVACNSNPNNFEKSFDVNSDDYKKFVQLIDQALELYERLPPTKYATKVMGGSDNKGLGNNVVFFKGSRELGQLVIDLLKKEESKQDSSEVSQSLPDS